MPMTPSSRPSKPVVSSLPPQWVDDVDAINETIDDITRLIGILSSMHSTRVGTVFGSNLDDMEMKIENMTGDITDKFRQAERLLMRVGMATKKCGGEEALIGANVQRRYVGIFVLFGNFLWYAHKVKLLLFSRVLIGVNNLLGFPDLQPNDL